MNRRAFLRVLAATAAAVPIGVLTAKGINVEPEPPSGDLPPIETVGFWLYDTPETWSSYTEPIYSRDAMTLVIDGSKYHIDEIDA